MRKKHVPQVWIKPYQVVDRVLGQSQFGTEIRFYVTCDDCENGEKYGGGQPNVAVNLLNEGFTIYEAEDVSRRHKEWHLNNPVSTVSTVS